MKLVTTALGTPEIILLLIVVLMVAGLVLVTWFIIRIINKKKVDAIATSSVNYYVNVTGSNDIKQSPSVGSVEVSTKQKELITIALPQQNEIRYVQTSAIIRCEADDNYTTFILDGERILVSKPLKEYADVLKPQGFLRTHQSHLINPDYVKSWLKEDGGMLLMKNGDKIAVSKPNRDFVKVALGKQVS